MKKKSNPPIERETTLSSINLLKADNLPFDIKAEVLARLIATKFELNTEDVLFQSRNYFQRWGRRDVLEISEGFSLQTEKKQWVFDVSREGMFDALPESVFLHPDDEYRDSEHRIKELTKQEQEARKFLRPFEQMFYWLRLENEQREAYAEKQLENWWQHLLVDGYTPFSNSKLDEDQLNMLTQMLPYLHDIVGNFSLTAQWLSLFLKTTVRIVELPPPQYPLPLDLQKRMDDGILGEDFVIGAYFTDGIPILEIKIEDLTPDTLGDYLEGSDKRHILEEELLSLLLPVEIPFDITLSLSVLSKEFCLGEKYDSSILGYTTCINSY